MKLDKFPQFHHKPNSFQFLEKNTGLYKTFTSPSRFSNYLSLYPSDALILFTTHLLSIQTHAIPPSSPQKPWPILAAVVFRAISDLEAHCNIRWLH